MHIPCVYQYDYVDFRGIEIRIHHVVVTQKVVYTNQNLLPLYLGIVYLADKGARKKLLPLDVDWLFFPCSMVLASSMYLAASFVHIHVLKYF
uniref:Predicted protein n=1 Tax=Hordeum vulgare subsp. vulgare TaxID=112509 RepID=F2DG89_HORVV|nr:predicted protein [Hordeum vulgare subsp. vulgare]